MDGSVDPDGEATAHESRVRSHLPASFSLRSRKINIGRGGDGLGLLVEIAGLALALFYGAPHTSAALDWWRRRLRFDGVEDALVGAAQDPDAPPFAMSPDLAAMTRCDTSNATTEALLGSPGGTKWSSTGSTCSRVRDLSSPQSASTSS